MLIYLIENHRKQVDILSTNNEEYTYEENRLQKQNRREHKMSKYNMLNGK